MLPATFIVRTYGRCLKLHPVRRLLLTSWLFLYFNLFKYCCGPHCLCCYSILNFPCYSTSHHGQLTKLCVSDESKNWVRIPLITASFLAFNSDFFAWRLNPEVFILLFRNFECGLGLWLWWFHAQDILRISDSID